MNCSVYIFGELSSGYTQYPEDCSSNVFKTLYNHCKAPTQIVIHRDGSMMLYCYIRKLDENKYIGLGIAVNGYYLSKIDELFSLFENAIEKMAQQGVFIHFVSNGTLTSNLKDLKFEEEEIDTLAENMRCSFEALGNTPRKLPHTDYSIAKDSVKEFSVYDDKNDIIRASYTYGFTYIYKQKDFETVRMNSYRSILSKINDENNRLKKRNTELQEQNKKILSQKKQYRNVVFLCILIVVCGIGLFFLKNSLDSTKNNLEKAQSDITQKTTTIETLNRKVTDLQTSLSEEQSRREKAEDDFVEFKKFLNDRQPFIVKKTSFSFNTGELSFDYYGLRDATVTLEAKAFNGDRCYSNSTSMYVKKGHQSFSIYLSSSLNSSNWYSFELLVGNKIVGGDRH